MLSPEAVKVNGLNGDVGRGGSSATGGIPAARKRARVDVAGHSNPPTFSSFDGGGEIDAGNHVQGHGGGLGSETLPSSDGASMTQGVLDQWAMWLCELPERFPGVPPRVFLWCMESVGAGALRDITVAGGEGFGAWWVVRCWMDEWMGWIAEKGGFLDMDSDTQLTGNIIHNNTLRSETSDTTNATTNANDAISGLLGDTLSY